MAYAILRFNKIKTRGKMSTVYRHNERLRETPNADKELTPKNRLIVGEEGESYLQAFDRITEGLKIRKNAVLGIEAFMGASPETFTASFNIKGWIRDSINWLQNHFGKDNVVKVHLHMDEATPHMHAFIVPMKDGKLNSKHYIGGHRDRLSELQTSYAAAVKQYGLERGVEGSIAKHNDIRRFYNAVNQELSQELPEPKALETAKKYRERVNGEYQAARLKGLSNDLNKAILEDARSSSKEVIAKFHEQEGKVRELKSKNKSEIKLLEEIKEIAANNPELRDTINNALKELRSEKKEQAQDGQGKTVKKIQSQDWEM